MEPENPTSEPWVIREVAHGSAEYWATVDLRSSILRKPIGLQYLPGELEDEKNARHIVCCRGNRLVGCLMLSPREGGDIQMRQIAIVSELQRHGIGKALVEYSEAWAQNAGYRRMILHARETAVAFYEKLGYSRIGDRICGSNDLSLGDGETPGGHSLTKGRECPKLLASQSTSPPPRSSVAS